MDKSILGLGLAISLFLAISCQNDPAVVDPIPEEVPVEIPQEDISPVEELPPPVEENEPISEEEPVYQVSEEVYNNTFAEIETLIGQLNSIIRDRNFRLWRSYLTQEYIDSVSDPENLRQFSETPIMRHLGIRLRNLEDYFEFVVVPSRSNARLDELVFQNDTKVTAYMFLNNVRSILYQLEKINGNWKITL